MTFQAVGTLQELSALVTLKTLIHYSGPNLLVPFG